MIPPLLPLPLINLITPTITGRQQAKITGQRLQKLAESYNQGKGFRYTSLIHSTMSRAVETSTIVHEFVLPDEPMNSDPMLIEGAPIPPEPPIGGWRPEPSVSIRFNPFPRVNSGLIGVIC